jgi:hypothetical protein
MVASRGLGVELESDIADLLLGGEVGGRTAACSLSAAAAAVAEVVERVLVDSAMAERCQQVAAQLTGEDGVGVAVQAITAWAQARSVGDSP